MTEDMEDRWLRLTARQNMLENVVLAMLLERASTSPSPKAWVQEFGAVQRAAFGRPTVDPSTGDLTGRLMAEVGNQMDRFLSNLLEQAARFTS